MQRIIRRLATACSDGKAWWKTWRTRQPAGLRWAGVEVRDTQLHMVVLAQPSPGAPVRVLECATCDLEGELSAATLAAFAEARHSRPQRWSLLLPRDDYRVSVIPAPAVPAEEWVHSVRWQLSPELDFPADDAAIDVMRIPSEPWDATLPSELYAIAARGDRVAAWASLFHAAGLSLSAIDIQQTAQRNIAALAERPDELLVMVIFAEQEVHITFSWHGELYLDRLIAEPRSDDDAPLRRALQCERIAVQVQRSLDAVHRSYPFMHATRILTAGAPEEFHTQLSGRISDPIEVFQADALFDLGDVPEWSDPAKLICYLPALGTALRGMSATERA